MCVVGLCVYCVGLCIFVVCVKWCELYCVIVG